MTASESNIKASYRALTPKMAFQLAAPHTWAAAIMPVLAACALAYANTGTLSALLAICLLAICILMQSSVNTFNDYFDYVKGADSEDDDVDPSDAVLVYNNVNPKHALTLAICMLVSAFALGIYAIWIAGWIPLAIGACGAVIVVLYSGGPYPLSYLPVGEAVSGFTMGGLITLACYQVLTQDLDFMALLWAIPPIIGIALIMFTNNTCDIEKDLASGRKTLSCLLGRTRAKNLYRVSLVLWLAAIAAIVLIWFFSGWVVLVFMLAATIPALAAIWRNPLAPGARIQAMSQISSLNLLLGCFYAMAIFASRAALTF